MRSLKPYLGALASGRPAVGPPVQQPDQYRKHPPAACRRCAACSPAGGGDKPAAPEPWLTERGARCVLIALGLMIAGGVGWECLREWDRERARENRPLSIYDWSDYRD